MSLKLISVNIESHKHLDKVMKLLQAEQPDVVCLQEVFQVDLPFFRDALDMEGHFLPLADIDHATNYQFDPLGIWGVAILTKLPHTAFGEAYYVRHDKTEFAKIQDFEPNSVDRGVIWTTVTKDDQPFTVATTHFTWSEEGSATELQAKNLADLLAILKPLPELVLCGDFNAPRGKATFQTLAERYTDNIPPHYTTSLDPELHRVGHLQLMVDGLFTTSQYRTKNVRLVTGVSDHQAIVGEIERAEA